MRGLIRVVQAGRGKPDAIGGLADMIVGRLTVEDAENQQTFIPPGNTFPAPM
jgi:hypothetical protein